MPTYNIELLEQVRDIIAEESKHNQASWAEVSRQVAEQALIDGPSGREYVEVACPTAACVAGWAVSLVGAKMIVSRTAMLCTRSSTINVDACLNDGQIVTIASLAREKLGLTSAEADALFAAEWSNEEVLKNLNDILVAAKHDRKWEIRWVSDADEDNEDDEDDY